MYLSQLQKYFFQISKYDFLTFYLNCEFVWSEPGLLWWDRCGQINKHPWLPWDWVIACVLFSEFCFDIFLLGSISCANTRILCSVVYNIPRELSQFPQYSQCDSADSRGLGLLLLNVSGKLRKKLKSLKNWATDPADNEDALKINICKDSSGAAPALNIHP